MRTFTRSKKFRRRKFILPFLIISVILIALLIKGVRDVEISLPWISGEVKEIASPLPVLGSEAKFIEIFKKNGLTVSHLQISGDEVVAEVSGTEIRLNLDDQIEKQVVSLQLILSRAKIENKLPKKVDLRFDRPVVSY